MQGLPGQVSNFIAKEDLLKPGDRLGVAVSGGADSVALLRVMLGLRRQLGILLTVIHFNHKLRGADSEADEEFVRELSTKNGLEFFCAGGDACAHSEKNHLSLEESSRSLRYSFFESVMQSARLNCVATAHTLDDQAETVLLKLARGAGTRGLAGIYPKLRVEQTLCDEPANPGTERFIVRPLLGTRRQDIESYLRHLGQDWREDKSNRDLRHSRNIVRHGILPRLERNLNPAVREALAETANIARAEEEYWNAVVAGALPTLMNPNSGGATLDAAMLLPHPLALQRRLLRAIAESLNFKLEFKHVEQILRVASDSNQNQSVVLPKRWIATRRAGTIIFSSASFPPVSDYEYKLPVPGRIEIPEAGKLIEALIRPAAQSGYNPDQAIDPALVASQLLVRNWRAGDRFWPGHSKSPKKIKELLQERHVTGTDRKRTPVVISGGEVIWMEGFPVPEALRPHNAKREVMIIRETAIE